MMGIELKDLVKPAIYMVIWIPSYYWHAEDWQRMERCRVLVRHTRNLLSEFMEEKARCKNELYK
ncbi:hypothetical protein LguiB_017652 [Lonicera macranthoides]